MSSSVSSSSATPTHLAVPVAPIRARAAPFVLSGSYAPAPTAHYQSPTASSTHAPQPQQQQQQTMSVSSFGSQASPHFKYNFLSAGRLDKEINSTNTTISVKRPGIMDATRSYDAHVVLDEQQRQALALQEAKRENVAAGLGYGTKHQKHFAYLSKELPPRDYIDLEQHPSRFPTAPSLMVQPRHTYTQVLPDRDVNNLLAATEAERRLDRADHVTNCASGLGYSDGHTTHYGYLSQPSWHRYPSLP